MGSGDQNDQVWYAECESGHALWDGPDQTKYADAQADADKHDQAVHGGQRTATVLKKDSGT